MKKKINRIKSIYENIKYYLNILTDFISLNKYVFYSSIFINKVDKLLKSNVDSNTFIYNLRLYYSDFKIEYFDDLDNGVTINNKFDKGGTKWFYF